MSYEKLTLEASEGITTVTLDNPKANALSTQVLEELDHAFTELNLDRSVRAVILTGAGRFFVAGADIKELAELSPAEAVNYSRIGQQVMDRIESLSVPVIAAVNGMALGGGCELAMACTLRIASETAEFGQPEVKLGLIPGFGGTQRLVRMVGMGAAQEMLVTGEPIGAEEALRLGLVNRVVAGEDLLKQARTLAERTAAVAPLAARWAKDLAYQSRTLGHGEGMQMEANLFGQCFATGDAREGLGAFLEKRKAIFKGE
jgi:enoyl-CoA hydratase